MITVHGETKYFKSSFCTHLGIVLPFPCKILGLLPLLSATDTPDELSVIHSIVAEPPKSGIDSRGALNNGKDNNGKDNTQLNCYMMRGLQLA